MSVLLKGKNRRLVRQMNVYYYQCSLLICIRPKKKICGFPDPT
jgi:hypothetical protein